jgi:hypothetical protein
MQGIYTYIPETNHVPKAGHKISGLNPLATSESLAAIFSRTDLS